MKICENCQHCYEGKCLIGFSSALQERRKCNSFLCIDYVPFSLSSDEICLHCQTWFKCTLVWKDC